MNSRRNILRPTPSRRGGTMRGAVSLYRSSIGKKVLMAVTGIILFLWVVGHMLGNLKAFQGAEKFDAYAEFLREIGSPVFGQGELLWLVRIGLLLAVGIHILMAVQLTRMSYGARPQKYQRGLTPDASTYASRTMRWGGVIIVLFVIYHLLHLTFGNLHPDFVEGGAYHNLVTGLSSWPVTVAYGLAMITAGLHTYHGIWSAFQTLGANHPRYDRYRRPLAAAVAIVLVVGFLSVPVSVLTGIIE